MYAVSNTIDQAMRVRDEGKHLLAISGYKVALSIIRGSCFDDEESSEVLVDGWYEGMPAEL